MGKLCIRNMLGSNMWKYSLLIVFCLICNGLTLTDGLTDQDDTTHHVSDNRKEDSADNEENKDENNRYDIGVLMHSEGPLKRIQLPGTQIEPPDGAESALGEYHAKKLAHLSKKIISLEKRVVVMGKKVVIKTDSNKKDIKTKANADIDEASGNLAGEIVDPITEDYKTVINEWQSLHADDSTVTYEAGGKYIDGKNEGWNWKEKTTFIKEDVPEQIPEIKETNKEEVVIDRVESMIENNQSDAENKEADFVNVLKNNNNVDENEDIFEEAQTFYFKSEIHIEKSIIRNNKIDFKPVYEYTGLGEHIDESHTEITDVTDKADSDIFTVVPEVEDNEAESTNDKSPSVDEEKGIPSDSNETKSESNSTEDNFLQPELQPPLDVDIELNRPNIVIFLADGVTTDDLGCYGGKTYTPNIDSIAENGVLLSQHIAGGLTDTSSRAALLTGRLPVRYGMAPQGQPDEIPTMASQSGLPANEITFAKLLQNNGYLTGLIGKWNLGVSCDRVTDKCHHPNNHGFGHFFGFPLLNQYSIPITGTQKELLQWPFIYLGGAILLTVLLRLMFGNVAVLAFGVSVLVSFWWFSFCFHNEHLWSSALMRNTQLVETPVDYEEASKRLVKEGVRFLRDVQSADKPFLLIVSWHHIHHGLKASNMFRDPHWVSGHLAKLNEMDWAVGEVMRSLKLLALDSNTLMYFTSTAGQHHSARGNGNDVQHLSTPGLVQWNNNLTAETVIYTPTSHMDMLPTLMRIAGVRMPTDRKFDGQDIVDQLMGRPTAPRMFFHYCGPVLHAVRYSNDDGRSYVGYLFTAHWQRHGGHRSPSYCDIEPPSKDQPLTIFDLGKESHIHYKISATHRMYKSIQRDMKEGIDEHRAELIVAGVEQFSWYRQCWHAYLQPTCHSGTHTCKDTWNALGDVDL